MKRFVAGAKCPQCGSTDRLYFEVGKKDKIYCTNCDYTDVRTAGQESKTESLSTSESPVRIVQGPDKI